ncbi:hypothetical protein [Flavobacterium sp. MDT1-60]|uniref:hypothetical protein n=1 Tax=Flavobacterium sp. MDT1-60 TaxID=1979344 RepID=UPI0017874DE6|nr:hypothetical protein [Flavobacterium sp. MDT1-60]QOG02083.1 hypothetical protein IHE43_20125 [Flavobacterium sp. MDT1-60]
MKNAISKAIILFFVFSAGCSKTEKVQIEVKNIIKSAEILTFKDLSDQQKKELEYCCSYYPSNWRDGVSFEKEKAYFVKTKIDNNLLASLTESNTFSKIELLNNGNTYLYGKYHNRWGFVDNKNDTIFETEKFEGHRIIAITRRGNIDELIVGPLVEKPKKMYIEISDSKNYPNLTPEYIISLDSSRN